MNHEWTEKARSINFDRLDQLVSERIAALKNIVHSNEKTGFSDEAMNAICRDRDYAVRLFARAVHRGGEHRGANRVTRPDYCPLWNEPCQKGCEPKCGTVNAWEKLRRENADLRAALDAVKQWDVARTLENLKLTGAVDFKLPQHIREQVQAALTHNAALSGPHE